MCGRFVAASPPADLVRIFQARLSDGLPVRPSWNVAPTNPVLGVVVEGGHSDGDSGRDSGGDSGGGTAPERVIEQFRWGLVPPWAKDKTIGSKMINARAETVAGKPSFRRAFKSRRCLIPADGFYEWKPAPGTKRKIPYYFTRNDEEQLAFAGLWETWHDPTTPDAPPLRTCTIITTEANRDMEAVHNRMPAIVGPSDWEEWIDPGIDDAGHLEHLLVPAPDGTLRCHPVSTAVNSPRNDGEELTWNDDACLEGP